MSIDKNILDKYSDTQNKVTQVKESIVGTILLHSDVTIKISQIDIKKETIQLLISSVKKYIVLEKKVEIESDLRNNNIKPFTIQ